LNGNEKDDEKHKFAARVMAETMRGMNIETSASTHIGGDFRANVNPVFEHEKCLRTQTQETHTLREDVRELCGTHAIVLRYEYHKPSLGTFEAGYIRMVEPNGDHYQKHYGVKGTFAFRQDTVLSHMSVMHGFDEEKANYPLAPGRMLPAISTDTAVKGGIYFYGSLGMCPSEGQGKWTPHTKQKELQAVFSAGIITIIEVTNVCAGPSNCSDAQWSKSGSSPECARVVGCIITESLAECFFDALPKTPQQEHTVIKEFVDILHNPQKYLDPKCLAFMHRYLAGGCFAAYGDWVPRRCVCG
jgi:hypothetical protein